MKKIIFIAASLIMTMIATAQNQTFYDGLIASNSELNGTARFVAVGGAMGALGGDASTVSYNPAGIGVYRSSELSITGNLHWTNTSMGGQQTSNYITANLANVSYIGTWLNPKAKGIITINFGISYNRLKNFAREGRYYNNQQPYSMSQFIAQQTNGLDPNAFYSTEFEDRFFNELDMGWRSNLGYEAYLFDPIEGTTDYLSYFDKIGSTSVNSNLIFSEYGSIDEYGLSLGGNVANIFYWGMSFNCDYLSYQRHTTLQETFQDGKSYALSSNYHMEGSGFAYKVGFIVKPVNWLRIGGAFHTPTWYYIRDWSEATVSYKRDGQPLRTPVADGWMNLESPLKALGSVGFVLGKFGFIGFDYQYTNYSTGLILRNRDNAIDPEQADMNEAAKNALTDLHSFRIGMEFKPIEALSLRLGGGYSLPYTKAEASRPYYPNDVRCDADFYNEKSAYNATCGIGYRIGRHAIDIAYVWQVNESDYYSFGGADPTTLRSVRNQVILSYGVRF